MVTLDSARPLALLSLMATLMVVPTSAFLGAATKGTLHIHQVSRPTIAARLSTPSTNREASFLEEWKETLEGWARPKFNLPLTNRSLQEDEARAFLEFLTGPSESLANAFDFCVSDDDNETPLELEHASFNQPWQGTETVERQWRLWWKSLPNKPQLEIVDMVSRKDKVAVRFDLSSSNNDVTRGVAILELNQALKIQRVFFVTESANKKGAASLELLRSATKIMELTGYNPARQLSNIAATNKTTGSSLAPLRYFDAWNQRDIDAAVEVFADDCTYDDTAFPRPFQGKDKLTNHLKTCANCFPESFSFQVDDCIVSNDRKQVCVQWHVDNNGETLPYTRGCSFYQLSSRGLIEDGIDFLEPNGPVKPGRPAVWKQTVVAQLKEEPVRLVPLTVWIAYIWIVFFADDILPGANVLELEPRTWEEVLNLSLNFFFVSPVVGLPFSPVVHPLLESVFNGLLAWAALFAGFLTDDRRNKPNLFPMVPAVIGMQFLTSAFLLPYLVFRSSEDAYAADDANDVSSTLPARIAENRILPVVLGSVGVFALYWALQGRAEEFGTTFPERWTSFIDLLRIDRVGSSFIVDLAIFALFQGWLVEDDALRRGAAVNPLLKNVAKYVPFFGLVAYLTLRPALSCKGDANEDN